MMGKNAVQRNDELELYLDLQEAVEYFSDEGCSDTISVFLLL